MKKFPKLYKKTGAGKTQTWQIIADGDEVYTMFGPIPGTIQTSARDKVKGKNIGRSNETTPEEQALSEAESKYTKKLKTGYVKTLEELNSGAVDDLVGGGCWPMLAKKFADAGKHIEFPCYGQPKLDGFRCIAQVQNGVCTLWTRTRKPILSSPHIIKAIEALDLEDCMLDGELYNHAWKDDFEALSHFIKQPRFITGCDQIQYHIYDAVIPGGFKARLQHLVDTVGHEENLPLVLVKTVAVIDETEVESHFKAAVLEGYEGFILRNLEGEYHGHPTHRSKDLQKVKEMDDDEFKIVGVKGGRGKLKGHGIFICAYKGETFDVKMAGPHENLVAFLEHPEDYVGRMLTVQYQGFTKKKVVPRFPIGLRFRDPE